MAAAPLVSLGISAASTVAGMAAQGRQAAAQRDAINAQNLAARQQADLMQQRFDFSRQSAEQTYMRERVLLDRQRDASALELSRTKLMTEMQQRQQGMELRQAEAAAEIQVQQLLSAASAQRTQGALENNARFEQLAQQLTGSREGANRLLQASAVSGLSGGIFDAANRERVLAEIAATQAAQEAANTTLRTTELTAQDTEAQASIQQRTADEMLNLYRSQLERQAQFNDFVFQRMPGILDLQFQRNESALREAQATNSASLSIQEQANQQNLLNTLAANNARASAIQGPNILAALTQLGGQIYNTAAAGGFNSVFGQQQQPAQPGTFAMQRVPQTAPTNLYPGGFGPGGTATFSGNPIPGFV